MTFHLAHGITVTVNGKAGAITSSLRSHLGGARPSAKDRLIADVLESLILAHACAGVPIDSAAYVAGLQDAIEAIAEHT